MRVKHIIIESCTSCPHIHYGGGFGEVAYIPRCERLSGTVLPYRKTVSGNRILAIASEVIPDWCPLDSITIGE